MRVCEGDPTIPYFARGVTDTMRMRRQDPAPGAGAGAVASASVLRQSGSGRGRNVSPSPVGGTLRHDPVKMNTPEPGLSRDRMRASAAAAALPPSSAWAPHASSRARLTSTRKESTAFVLYEARVGDSAQLMQQHMLYPISTGADALHAHDVWRPRVREGQRQLQRC